MERPNILLIIVDDMGWKDLGCCGSVFYESPRIDALAAEGIRFSEAYAASPVCSPSRAAIMTGMYPARLRLTDYLGAGVRRGKVVSPEFAANLPDDVPTVAQQLRRMGYRTWYVGKWHLGSDDAHRPERYGFDVNIAGCHWGHPRRGYFSPYGIPAMEDGPEGEFLTDRLTREAASLIRSAGDSPFFLCLAYHAVHTPIEAKLEVENHFAAKAAAMGLDAVNPFVVGEKLDVKGVRHLNVVRRIVQSDPAYAAMIRILDDNVGYLVDVLQECGLLEETWIVFTSDNGGLSTAQGSPTCNLPLAEGKGWMEEGGLRVPLIVRPPGGRAKGKVCDVPVSGTDLFPTILRLAGMDERDLPSCDGADVSSFFRGDEGSLERPLFWHFPHYSDAGGRPSSAVRLGRWKLIRMLDGSGDRLFDLQVDPGEHRDLYSVRGDVLEELRGMLESWYRSVDAVMPRPNPRYPWG